MPKRTFWLTAGVALGAGSTLWAERRVRRTIEETAAKLAPDALVAEVGRTARHVAESTGDRFRDAYSAGRDQMLRREEELWSNLSNRGIPLPADGRPTQATPASPAGAAGSGPIDASAPTSGQPAETGDSTRPARAKQAKRAKRATQTKQTKRATQAKRATRAKQVARATQRGATGVARRQLAERSAKSPSHLGK
jgi:hypothetical protein